MPSFRVTGATLALLSLVPSVFGDCESFGIDFTSGGTFFQNSNSTDPFTALQSFTGCQDDTAHNVFVNPSGDQSECSETPLTPDDEPQLVTCQDWPKDRLYDGDWSLLIISNNGEDGEPIAYQRDFSLTVGTQQTTTVTPTVTVSNVETPVQNVTSTVTSLATETADASTITSGRGTHTITPKPTTITKTRGLITLTQRTQTWQVIPSTKTVAASCSVQPTHHVKDPIASIVPYVLGDLNHIVEDVINLNKGIIGGVLDKVFHPFGRSRFNAGFHFKREILAGRTPSEELKKAFVAERSEKLKREALGKRAPDARTKTVTDETPVTSTVDLTAPATTQTVYTTVSSTTTSTPPPVTAGPVTTTARQITKTKQINLPIVVTTNTRTYTTTIVNTATTTAPGAKESCAKKGGVLLD
ncbi:hypothetical protein WHR41_04974 [Cladosporium halotolerans]|uniref:Uncharacterized protein n=1 Tax=Cladosporium halotolerans TaxID=1052096 RepID=A0AB34KP11_9PEZI